MSRIEKLSMLPVSALEKYQRMQLRCVPFDGRVVWLRDAEVEEGAGEALAEMLRSLRKKLSEQFDAYPVSVFPEPDLERVAKILAEHGIALDCVSASAIRAALGVTERIVNSVLPPNQ